jgi:hypothetical protein
MPSKSPPPRKAEVTAREDKFFEMLFEFQVLAARQFRELFYPAIADTTFNNRMRLLKQAGYIDYPTRQQKLQHAIPEENIYWLGVKGIAWIAARQGIDDIDFESVGSERSKKILARQLLDEDIYWLRKPWKQLAHRLAANDLRLAAYDACGSASLHWDRWLPESDFHTGKPDRVTFEIKRKEKNGEVKIPHKNVPYYPDGLFWVFEGDPEKPDDQEVFSFIVECDMGTKEGPRVIRQNIMPALAYLKSEGYNGRTGFHYGRVLLITTVPGRVDNLKALTEKQTNSQSVFLTTFSDLERGNFFIDDLWRQSSMSGQVSLIEPVLNKEPVEPPNPLPPEIPHASV